MILYDQTSDPKLLDIAHRLINEEQNVKYKKKYKSAIRS